MASIGLLAAGVAHEVNTPLTGISSFTQMLLEQADPEDPRTRLLEKIERQTFRAAKIVNSLLHLSRPVQSETGPVDLHVVINDVLSLLEHQFKAASVQVRKDLQADGTMVRAVEHKLQQVFLNLFLNARDAMPKGGWVTIATRRDEDMVVVEISDTGAGIPSEHLARIYDPFFSTKPIGQGTGLGLSITYGIVQEHDGTIVCDSQVGQGTRFTLVPPGDAAVPGRVGGGDERRVTRSREASAMGTARGTILVIDDEEVMREVLEALLAREGYDVRLAVNGMEGLELARSHAFDAAVVDVMMPGIDGLSVLDELKAMDEDLPVVMVTAFASVENGALRDEARRLRLHHQAVQERRGRRRPPQRRRADAPVAREPHRSSRTCRATAASSPTSSAAAAGCGRCSTW